MASNGRRHPFDVLDYEGERVEIDAGIVPLVQLLWTHGFETFNSCEDFDGRGIVWVEFDGPSATDFLNLVGQDPELRGHVLHKPTSEHGWTYSVLPWQGWRDEPEGIRFLVSVHFPRRDLAGVVAALEAAGLKTNERKGANGV